MQYVSACNAPGYGHWENSEVLCVCVCKYFKDVTIAHGGHPHLKTKEQ